MKNFSAYAILLVIPLFILQVLFVGCSNPASSPAAVATATPTPYYSSAPTTLVSSVIVQPYGMTFDSFSGSGNLWILDGLNPGMLYEYTTAGAAVTSSQYYTGTSPYKFPYMLCTDPNGYLYIADIGNNQVDVMTNAGVYVSVIPGLTKASGVAVNSAGTTLYVSEDTSPVTTLTFSITGAGYPKTYTPTANSFPTAAGPYEPSRGGPIVLDASGNVYQRDFNGTEIIKYHPDGSSPATFVAAGLQPLDMAFDGSGNLFVTEQMSPEFVQEYTSSGNASVSIGGFATSSNLTGLTLDASNTLYVADSFHGYIYKVTK